jgi:hypothetical protein
MGLYGTKAVAEDFSIPPLSSRVLHFEDRTARKHSSHAIGEFDINFWS